MTTIQRTELSQDHEENQSTEEATEAVVVEQNELPELPPTPKQLYPHRSRFLGWGTLISAGIETVADSIFMTTLIYPERHYINVFYMAIFFGLSGVFTLLSSRFQTLTIYMVCIIFNVFSTIAGIAALVFTCVEISNEEKILGGKYLGIFGANPKLHMMAFALRFIAIVFGIICAISETYFSYQLIHGASRTGQSYSPIVKNSRYKASDLKETET